MRYFQCQGMAEYLKRQTQNFKIKTCKNKDLGFVFFVLFCILYFKHQKVISIIFKGRQTSKHQKLDVNWALGLTSKTSGPRINV